MSILQKRRAGAAFVLAAVGILVVILAAVGVISVPANATVPTTCSKTQVIKNTLVNGKTVSKCVEVGNDAKLADQPVAKPMSTWQGVVDFGTNHPSYISCFQQVTGHPWSDAIAANRAQKAGWKTTVLIESNISDAQASSVLAAQKLMKDSDVRPVNGFINTRTSGCVEFGDNRVQAREALTFPGKDKFTPGDTAVLEICGNPVGKPGVAVHKVVLPRQTPTSRRTPSSTPTPTPTPRRTPPPTQHQVCTSGKCSPSGPPIMTNPLLPPAVAGPNKPTDKPALPGTNENPGPTGCGGPCPIPIPLVSPSPVIPPENGTPPPVDGIPAPAPTTQIPPPVI